MAKVEIYTTAICPFCDRAKALLRKKGISYDEIDVGADPDLRQAMVERTGGRRTVPQIFIDGVPVGGSDDLYALEAKGLLDALLMASAEG
ncbi:MAG TPA: glutaredoxin 3 [bacterium]|jgi:glutaredoxin 3